MMMEMASQTQRIVPLTANSDQLDTDGDGTQEMFVASDDGRSGILD